MAQKNKSKFIDKHWQKWVLQTARTWNDVADVIKVMGIDTIDEDHKMMTEYVLEINDMIQKVETHQFDLEFINAQSALFDKLKQTALAHFEREEKIIQEYNIPGLQNQELEHGKFIKFLQSYQDDFNAGKLTISLQLKLDILDWWVHHINEIDYNIFCTGTWQKKVLSSAFYWDDLSHIIKGTGLEELDDEHQELTEITLEINRILDENGESESFKEQHKEDLKTALLSLKEVTTRHFKNEEDLIERFGLDHLEEQQTQHVKFHQILEDVKGDFEKPIPKKISEIQKIILDWWVKHINELDFKTFRSKDWIIHALGKAEDYEEIQELIKKTQNHYVDDDHKKILILSLNLNQVLTHKNHDLSELEKEELKELSSSLFQELYDFVAEHFEREIEIIKEKGLPNLKLQLEQHVIYLDMLKDYQKDISAGRVNFSRHIKGFLMGWFGNHINVIDFHTFRGESIHGAELPTIEGSHE